MPRRLTPSTIETISSTAAFDDYMAAVLAPGAAVDDLPATPSTAEIATRFNELLASLRNAGVIDG